MHNRSAHAEALRRRGGGAGRRQGGRARAHRGVRGEPAHRGPREGGEGAAVPAPSAPGFGRRRPARRSCATRAQLLRDLAQMDSEVGEHARGVRRAASRLFANNSAMVQYLPGDLSRFLSVASADPGGAGGGDQPGHRPRAVADGVCRHRHLRRQRARRPGSPCCPVPRGPAGRGRPRSGHPLREAAVSARLTAAPAYDLVGMQEGSSIDALVTQVRRPNWASAVKLRIRTAGFEAIGRMVQAGLGIAIMPQLIADSYRSSLKIAAIPLAEPWAVRRLDLARPGHGRAARRRRGCWWSTSPGGRSMLGRVSSMTMAAFPMTMFGADT